MDLRQDLNYWQVIDLPDGTTTPGKADHRSNPAYLNIDNPQLLKGKRVLDVAANDGFWSFWAERQGAEEVLATDIECLKDYDWGYAGPPPGTPVGKRSDSVFHHLHELLDSKVQHRTLSVYDHDPAQIGQFDLVFCYGLIYHLRHPLRAIDALRRVCCGACVIESHVLLCSPDVPMMAFYEDDVLQGAISNWCGPTVSCMTHWMKSAGFETIYMRRNLTGDRQLFVGVVNDEWRTVFDNCPNLRPCEDAHFKSAHHFLGRALQAGNRLSVSLSTRPMTSDTTSKNESANIVKALFEAFLGRPADAKSLEHFVPQLDKGLSPELLSLIILTSPEMKRRFLRIATSDQYRKRLGDFCGDLLKELSRETQGGMPDFSSTKFLERSDAYLGSALIEDFKKKAFIAARKTLPEPIKALLKSLSRNPHRGPADEAHADNPPLMQGLSLSERIDSCPLYRRAIANDDISNKPLCVCCESRDVPAAEVFFKERYGIIPQYWSVIQWRKDWLRGIRATLQDRNVVFLEDLAEPRDLQPVIWVQPPRERSFSRILAEYGVRNLLFAYDPNYAGSIASTDFYEKNREALESVYALLEDVESQETFASVLRHRRENNCGYLRIASYAEYEHPLVCVKPGERVVDAGGFDGRTSIRFAEQAGKKGHVLCFEPVQGNLRLIRENLANQKDSSIKEIVQPVPMGVGLGRCKVPITVAGGSSKVAGSGGIAVNNINDSEIIDVTDLSSFWEEQGLGKLDLISLDIEGLEMDALQGAEKLIRRFRPKLQISIYHKPEDLYEIPLWINGLGLGYRFFMGHHDSFLVETDLYATAERDKTAHC